MKNINQFSLAAFVFFLFFLFSCTKEIPFDIEDQKSKIVINSLFSTDTTWMVQISKSANILESNHSPSIQNAQVNIYNSSDQLVTSLSHLKNGIYNSTDIKPMANQFYKIEVSAPDYESVYAEETVPKAIQILSLDTSTIDDAGYKSFALDLTFKDPSTKDNYFLVELYVKGESYQRWGVDSGKTINFEHMANIRSKDKNVEDFGNENFGNEDLEFDQNFLLLRDQLFNGLTHTIRINTSSFISSSNVTYEYAEIRIYNISKSFFNYKSSLKKYNSSNGNPLAQPTQVFSNIENGIGIFAGASMASRKMVF